MVQAAAYCILGMFRDYKKVTFSDGIRPLSSPEVTDVYFARALSRDKLINHFLWYLFYVMSIGFFSSLNTEPGEFILFVV